jgi:hypothetical protein
VRVFRHRLLQHFMLSLFCKLPVQPMTRIRDMRAGFMVRASPPALGLGGAGLGLATFLWIVIQFPSCILRPETCTMD